MTGPEKNQNERTLRYLPGSGEFNDVDAFNMYMDRGYGSTSQALEDYENVADFIPRMIGRLELRIDRYFDGFLDSTKGIPGVMSDSEVDSFLRQATISLVPNCGPTDDYPPRAA
jgi:hypothetical protein